MQIINYGTETAPKWLAVATVSIKGEEQDIIPAFTDYSIKQKDFSKDKVFTAMDKSSNPQPIGFRGILLVKRQKFILLYIFLA